MALALLASFVCVSTAGASVSARNPNGRMLGSVLAKTPATAKARAAAGASSSENLVNHGGPVMHADHTYAVYWEPTGSVSTSAYKDQVDAFLTDVAADSAKTTNVYATQPLYWDSTGISQYASSFEGRIVDSNPYPASGCSGPSGGPCLSDTQLQTELQRLVAAQSLPTGPSTMYLIFTPPNVDSCFGSDCSFEYFCAYHSWIGSGSSALIYTDQPYVGGRSGCDTGTHPNANDADPVVNVVSHEQNEAVTDPEGTGWWDDYGEEIGDKCAWDFGTPLGSTASGSYNQLIAGHDYWLQQEWSNAVSGCVQTNSEQAPPSVTMSASTLQAAPGDSITFTATGSDPFGTIVSYAWDFGDGQTATGTQVSHAYSGYGTYTVTVTVTDSNGETATDSQSVWLSAQPVAVAKASSTNVQAGSSVTFDGSASHSPGGPITNYTWYFYEPDGAYSTASGASATHTMLHPGSFEAELDVTDAAGYSSYTEVYVTVTPRLPIAAMTASTTEQFTNLSIDFDATGSSGPDYPIVSYEWDFADGHTSTSSSPSHTYTAAGYYDVWLTVTDTHGQTARFMRTVTISDQPPIPLMVYLPHAPIAGQQTEFDGRGSYAPGGTVTRYIWQFGDGHGSTEAAPDHVFEHTGTYMVRLSIADSGGVMATTTQWITVSSDPAAGPELSSLTAATPPSAKLTLAGHQRRAQLRSHGLRFSVSCHAACKIAYELVIPAGHSTPERHLAHGSAALSAKGSRRITSHLSRSALKQLTPKRKAMLIVEVTDPKTHTIRWLAAATTVR